MISCKIRVAEKLLNFHTVSYQFWFHVKSDCQRKCFRRFHEKFVFLTWPFLHVHSEIMWTSSALRSSKKRQFHVIIPLEHCKTSWALWSTKMRHFHVIFPQEVAQNFVCSLLLKIASISRNFSRRNCSKLRTKKL